MPRAKSGGPVSAEDLQPHVNGGTPVAAAENPERWSSTGCTRETAWRLFPTGCVEFRRPGLRRSAVQHRLRLRRLRRPPRSRAVPRLDAALGPRGRARAEARRHVLAGDRRRVRGRAEGPLPPRAGPVAAELGDLVLHLRRELHEEVQPQPRPPVLLREGPEAVHVQRPRRSASPPPGSWSTPTRAPTPRAGCPTTPGSSARRTCPTASRPTRTPGTSPASAAPSRSAPAGTAARCPSSSWAGSSAPARTPARSCSTPSPAAARRWPSPRSWAAATWASSSRPNTPPQIEARLDAAERRPAARRRRRADGRGEGAGIEGEGGNEGDRL